MAFAERVSFQFPAVGVVDEPVQEGVGHRWIRDHFVPRANGKLAGDEGGAVAVPVIEDLQKLTALAFIDLDQAPVVNDQHLDLGDLFEQLRQAAIGRGAAQGPKQCRRIEVERPVDFAARLVCQRTSDEGFAAAG